MKRTLTMLGLLAVVGSANAAIFSENFDGGGTGVFTVTNINAVMWADMSATGDGNYTGGTGNAMTANSDFAGTTSGFDTIATANVNAVGYENLVLSFLVNFHKFGANGSVSGGDNDRLEIWAGGGLIDTIASDTGGFFATPGVAKSYNLSPALNNSTFDIKFRYVDDGGVDVWEWYAQVDDVMVDGTVVPEPATMAVLGLGVAALARRRRK